MARKRPSFVCQECGTAHGQWVGKCDGCGAWNSLVEESTEDLNPGGLKNRSAKGKAIEFADLQAKSTDVTHHLTGIGEFDRVCGGGVVPGGALLVGGDPGIGKSTLLLQVAARLARTFGLGVACCPSAFRPLAAGFLGPVWCLLPPVLPNTASVTSRFSSSSARCVFSILRLAQVNLLLVITKITI